MTDKEKETRENTSYKPNSSQNNSNPMNTISNLFQQYLNQAQATYGLNSWQYQKLVKEQKEAMAVLEKASEEEQREYLALIRELSSLLEKNPNLSALEQQRIITLSQKADNFTEQLKTKQLKTQQQQKTNVMLWVCGGLVGVGLIGLVVCWWLGGKENSYD